MHLFLGTNYTVRVRDNLFMCLVYMGYGTAGSGCLPCKEDNSGVRIPSIPPPSWPVRRCRKLVKHGAVACPPQGIF